MGANSGANMLRVLGVLTTAVLMSTAGPDRPSSVARVEVAEPAAAIDVAALLAAARGAPPLICGLAAQSLGNGNWGGWYDAPASPLGAAARPDNGDRREIRE